MSNIRYSANWYNLWNGLPKMIEWNDIQEGVVYHIPKIKNKKRKDILVVAKTNYSIIVKTIAEDGKATNYETCTYLFPQEEEVKRMVEKKM